MTAFLALFGDAWRRARDRRSVVFLVVIAFGIAASCASLGFTQPDPRESLRLHLENFSKRTRRDGGPLRNTLALRRVPRVDARAPAAEDDLPLGLEHVAVADFEISDVEDFDRVARSAAAERARRRGHAPPDRSAGPLTARQRMDAVADDLRDRGWETVLTRPHDESGSSLFVVASTAHLAELEGRWKFQLLFGAAEIPIPIEAAMSPAELVIEIERGVAALLVGMLGMLVLLMTFGNTLPDLLQKGAVDLVLARPISRTRLLLSTYAGAVLTVLIVTALLLGVCAVTLGFRSGHFSPAFVGCSLTATAIFAAVFPVAMLAGLITRRGNFAAVVALACYGAADMIGNVRTSLRDAGVASGSEWTKVVDVLYWLAPKTNEIATLGLLRMGRTELSPSAFERFQQNFPGTIDAAHAYGTTALFAALFLGLTLLLFRHRDF